MAETTASALTSKDGEHVLLVDHGPVPAEVGQRSLEAIGYTVTVQTDSLEALRIFHDHPQRFDAVVTDMHMPVMAGDKLAREMMAIRPDLPVVLCVESGDLIDETKAMQSGIRSFITKPLDQQQLAGALRRALDGGNPQ